MEGKHIIYLAGNHTIDLIQFISRFDRFKTDECLLYKQGNSFQDIFNSIGIDCNVEILSSSYKVKKQTKDIKALFPTVYISLSNSTQMCKINNIIKKHNQLIPYSLYIDEADLMTCNDKSIRAVQYQIMKNNVSYLTYITATPESIFVKESIIASSVHRCEEMKTFAGLYKSWNDINKVILSDKYIEKRKLFKKNFNSITYNKYIKKHYMFLNEDSNKNDYRTVDNRRHPHILLHKTYSENKDQEALYNYIKKHDSDLFIPILCNQGNDYSEHLETVIRDEEYIRPEDGYIKSIIIIGDRRLDRAVSINASNYRVTITAELYIPGNNTTAPQMKQAQRVQGRSKNDIQRILFTTRDVITTMDNYNEFQKTLANEVSKIKNKNKTVKALMEKIPYSDKYGKLYKGVNSKVLFTKNVKQMKVILKKNYPDKNIVVTTRQKIFKWNKEELENWDDKKKHDKRRTVPKKLGKHIRTYLAIKGIKSKNISGARINKHRINGIYEYKADNSRHSPLKRLSNKKLYSTCRVGKPGCHLTGKVTLIYDIVHATDMIGDIDTIYIQHTLHGVGAIINNEYLTTMA